MAVSGFYFAWESWIITLFQSLSGPAVTALMTFVTLFGEEAVLVMMLAVIYWGFDKELGEKMGINILTSICFCPLVKNLFLRYRPYFVISEVSCIRPARQGDMYDIAVQGYSFPSGHACSSAAAYGTVCSSSRDKAVRAVCILLTVLICISRVYLGVHFPTDVLAGAAIGAAVVFLNGILMRREENRNTVLLCIIALCSAGLFFCRTEDYFTSYGVLTGGLAGMMFERKHVGFSNTDRFLVMLSRTAGGIAVFLVVNWLLRTAFGHIVSTEYVSLILRAFRYAVSSFTAIGLYPLVFRLENN